jgi:hypothetical protein
MLRYKLRTLLIVLTIGPPLLAGAWFVRYDLLPSLAIVLGLLFVATMLGICTALLTWFLGYY